MNFESDRKARAASMERLTEADPHQESVCHEKTGWFCRDHLHAIFRIRAQDRRAVPPTR